MLQTLNGILFGLKSVPDLVQVDFLLPNGYMHTAAYSLDATLKFIRDSLWQELNEKKAMTLFEPGSKNNYTFLTVLFDSSIYEILNYDVMLCNLNLLHWFFQIVENKGDEEVIKYNASLGKENLFLKNFTSLPDYSNISPIFF
jgi:hypothetical protein